MDHVRLSVELDRLSLRHQLRGELETAAVLDFARELIVNEPFDAGGGQREQARQTKAEEARIKALVACIPSRNDQQLPAMPPRAATFPLALSYYGAGGKARVVDRMMNAAREGVGFGLRHDEDPVDAAVVHVLAEATLALCFEEVPLRSARSAALGALDGVALPTRRDPLDRASDKLERSAAKIVRETLRAMGVPDVDSLTASLRRRRAEGATDG